MKRFKAGEWYRLASVQSFTLDELKELLLDYVQCKVSESDRAEQTLSSSIPPQKLVDLAKTSSYPAYLRGYATRFACEQGLYDPELMRSANTFIRRCACCGVGMRRDKAQLRAYLKDPHPNVRQEALEALKEIQEEANA